MADPTSWDILDEDFEDLTDWTDADILDGVSEISPAGQLHEYANITDGDQGRRTRDIGTFPAQWTLEIRAYIDEADAYGGYARAVWQFEQIDGASHCRWRISPLFLLKTTLPAHRAPVCFQVWVCR